jgi:hypothetical protein
MSHKPMSSQTPRIRNIISATLVAVVVLVPLLFGAYAFTHRDRLFPPMNTVVVYGRETCGITKMVRSGLDARHITYVFADIDVSAIKDELNYKLGPHFKEPRYTLPVVHVGGALLLTPTADQVQNALIKVGGNATRDYSTFLDGSNPAPHY